MIVIRTWSVCARVGLPGRGLRGLLTGMEATSKSSSGMINAWDAAGAYVRKAEVGGERDRVPMCMTACIREHTTGKSPRIGVLHSTADIVWLPALVQSRNLGDGGLQVSNIACLVREIISRMPCA